MHVLCRLRQYRSTVHSVCRKTWGSAATYLKKNGIYIIFTQPSATGDRIDATNPSSHAYLAAAQAVVGPRLLRELHTLQLETGGWPFCMVRFGCITNLPHTAVAPHAKSTQLEGILTCLSLTDTLKGSAMMSIPTPRDVRLCLGVPVPSGMVNECEQHLPPCLPLSIINIRGSVDRSKVGGVPLDAKKWR